MPKSQRRREGNDKGAANADKPLTKSEAAKAMDRFKSLARSLLAVPKEKIEEEERLFRRQRAVPRKRRKSGR